MSDDLREREPQRDEGDFPPEGGTAKTAGGGYGSGSDRQSSGGTGEGQAPAGEDAQTDWLRSTGDDPPGSEQR